MLSCPSQCPISPSSLSQLRRVCVSFRDGELSWREEGGDGGAAAGAPGGVVPGVCDGGEHGWIGEDLGERRQCGREYWHCEGGREGRQEPGHCHQGHQRQGHEGERQGRRCAGGGAGYPWQWRHHRQRQWRQGSLSCSWFEFCEGSGAASAVSLDSPA